MQIPIDLTDQAMFRPATGKRRGQGKYTIYDGAERKHRVESDERAGERVMVVAKMRVYE